MGSALGVWGLPWALPWAFGVCRGVFGALGVCLGLFRCLGLFGRVGLGVPRLFGRLGLGFPRLFGRLGLGLGLGFPSAFRALGLGFGFSSAFRALGHLSFKFRFGKAEGAPSAGAREAQATPKHPRGRDTHRRMSKTAAKSRAVASPRPKPGPRAEARGPGNENNPSRVSSRNKFSKFFPASEELPLELTTLRPWILRFKNFRLRALDS